MKSLKNTVLESANDSVNEGSKRSFGEFYEKFKYDLPGDWFDQDAARGENEVDPRDFRQYKMDGYNLVGNRLKILMYEVFTLYADFEEDSDELGRVLQYFRQIGLKVIKHL